MHRPPKTVTALLALAAIALVAGRAAAQHDHSRTAPELEVDTWLNVEAGGEPTLEALRGKVVMVEFWGTWCEPCLRSMPHVQELYDRYKGNGLVVLAVSNEAREVVEPFVRETELSMPVGCDPDGRSVKAFGVSSWPRTYLLDSHGHVGYEGSPYGVEPAIRYMLGLESDPGRILSTYLAMSQGQDDEHARAALEQLVGARPRAFDLAAWAEEALAGAAPQPAEGATASELLDRCAAAAAAGDEAAEGAALAALAATRERAYDLLGWARRRYAAARPLTLEELDALLAAQEYEPIVEGLLYRAPSDEVRARVAGDAGLVAWSAQRARESREMAKRGLMLTAWTFADVEPKNSQAFWSDLGIAGLQPDPEGRLSLGVPLGLEHVGRENVASWLQEQLERAVLLRSIASSRVPSAASLSAQVRAERKRTLSALERRYGL